MILRITTLCLALSLAACDSGDKPAGPPNEPAKPTPVTRVEPEASRKGPPPVATRAAAPAAPVLKSKGKTADEGGGASAEEVALTKPELDLSLPRELVESLEPAGMREARTQSEDGLLPPMFAEKDDDQQPFQLSGRIISNEIQRNGIEGAELQFHFRR
jgi:hypothetical protein